MSKKHKTDQNRKSTATPAGKRISPARWATVVAATAVVLLGVWLWETQRAPNAPTAPPPVEGQATNPPPGATSTQANLEKLKGRWLRPDGGYIIEIRSVEPGGNMDAAYFNPRPIHVAKAEASQDGAVTKVFIELRDVNYPGSTYTLAYDPQSDRLNGIYYQAVQQQQFEVFFVRTK